MNPQMMQYLMAYMQGQRPPMVQGQNGQQFGGPSQMEALASMFQGGNRGGSPMNNFQWWRGPGVNSAMAGSAGPTMNLSNWSKPQAKPSTGGILGGAQKK